ncbi:conserved hypothetical protein [Trichinella spiralis]|uniref:hypothetical protein n=1 Tax=Trichinella spiralis TaxID=6334 RepID=UPI0001EFBC09|nr:conserved hypothetical protein [Trichinella spiralis]
MLGEDPYHCNYCNITGHEGILSCWSNNLLYMKMNSCFLRLSVSCPLFYCRWHYHSFVKKSATQLVSEPCMKSDPRLHTLSCSLMRDARNKRQQIASTIIGSSLILSLMMFSSSSSMQE